jgi:hypothetical protein
VEQGEFQSRGVKRTEDLYSAFLVKLTRSFHHGDVLRAWGSVKAR